MNYLAHLLTPAAMRLIALTLMHFLWQGTALAALASAGMAFCRTASSRYAIGVAMLVLMAATPGITFLALRSLEDAGVSANSYNDAVVRTPTTSALASGSAKLIQRTNLPVSESVPAYFFWLVELWFIGVMLFSLRSAGGVLVLERLRRAESKPVSDELLKLCLSLKEKMDLQRLVRFCECLRLEAPAVVGWLRPAVLLPVSALTGLSEAQLSSVIAHELAHVKRFDAFVNLFQISVETLLFYHPAVWWLNKRIREERENCCDDMAVAACGSPLTYAHALAHMAESSASPRFIMAANSRPLAARVARLLGVGKGSGGNRGTDLSLGLLCLSASLVAGVAFIGVARNVHAQVPVPEPSIVSQPARASVAPSAIPVIAAQPQSPRSPAPAAAPRAEVIETSVAISVLAPTPAAIAVPASVPTPQTTATPAAVGSSSYIDGLKAAGLVNLTVDQLIALKIQGVTPDYVKTIRDLGLQVDADNLISMKIQGVSPEYVREMRASTGETLDADDLIAMKIQGVTPEYVKQMQGLGLKVDAEELIGMKIQGVSPEYIQEMRKLEVKADSGELTGMKIQGVTPEYVREINALGFHPDAGELIGMKVQGITADYLKKMQEAGFKLDVGAAIGAKVMGVTPEFIEQARSHGFKDLSLEQLIGLKQAGVLDNAKP
jgi:beta-lactamase regulating signal transducer with metallopeptidase domain